MTTCRALGIACFKIADTGWHIWAASNARGLARVRIEFEPRAPRQDHPQAALERGIHLLLDGRPLEVDVQPGGQLLDGFFEELERYFAGDLRDFRTPVDLSIGTAFQKRVWAELQRIPHGESISYGELARRIGKPGAARAVGGANGRNPVPIIVPCHRVIAGDGGLGGFTGGLAIKRYLLELESAYD